MKTFKFWMITTILIAVLSIIIFAIILYSEYWTYANYIRLAIIPCFICLGFAYKHIEN